MPVEPLDRLPALTTEEFLVWQLSEWARAIREGTAGSIAHGQALRGSRETHEALIAHRRTREKEGEGAVSEDETVDQFRADWRQTPQRLRDRLLQVIEEEA